MVREDSCHGDSGDGEGGLFGRRAAASCDGLQARQPESASAVACGGAGWDEPGRCRADRWHGPPDAAGLGARELETERAAALAAAPDEAMAQKITSLQRVRGIGANFSAVLVREVLYRSFANRRQLASYVGVAPMPYQSGGMDRDRNISRAGNPRARTTLIQLAWLWLR